jgi:Tol biopolymer transport system component
MSDPGDKEPPGVLSPTASDRLDSWKEIAAYLRRGVSTVQRWEREEGLPTHRLHHSKLGSVYAHKSELDLWVRERRKPAEQEEVATGLEEEARPSPDSVAAAGESTGPAEAVARGSRAVLSTNLGGRGRGLWFAVGALTLAGLLSVSGLVNSPSPAPSPAPPRTYPVTSGRGIEQDPALSPDGGRVAYVASDGVATFDLFVRALGSENDLRLTTSAASECCPAWSPDQQTLAFLRLHANEAVLLTMPALGGSEQRRVSLTPWFGSGLSWSPDGRFIAYSDRDSPGAPFVIKQLSLETREVRRITEPSAAFSGDAFPKYSPDGRQLALARLGIAADVTDADIYVVGAEGGEPRRLTHDRQFVGDLDWARDGRHVFFFSNRSEAVRLWRAPVSGEGPSLAWPGGDPFSRDGFAEALMDVSHAFRFSTARSVSRMSLTKRHYDTNIYRYDPHAPDDRQPSTPFIGSSQTDESPQVSPDGKRIAFSSSRSGRQQLWLCASDGSACGVLATTPHGGTPRWSPDGRFVAFDAWSEKDAHADIFIVEVDTLAVQRVTSSEADDVVPSWSRDGQKLYFSSNRTRTWQVYNVPARGGEPRQLTHEGGFAAFETPDAKAVLYTRFNAPGLFQVQVEGGSEKRLLDEPRCWGQWTMTREGIYWLDALEGGLTHLEFLGFESGASRRVATLPHRPPCAESSLAAFPDGRSLLYVGVEESSDIAGVDEPL